MPLSVLTVRFPNYDTAAPALVKNNTHERLYQNLLDMLVLTALRFQTASTDSLTAALPHSRYL